MFRTPSVQCGYKLRDSRVEANTFPERKVYGNIPVVFTLSPTAFTFITSAEEVNVFVVVFLFVCLSVCLSVSNFSQKRPNGFV